MEYTRLSSGLVKCKVTADELRARGIDPINFSGKHKLVRSLYEEILEHTVSNFGSAESVPFILEAVPTYDSLNLIISLGDSEEKEIPQKTDDSMKEASPVGIGDVPVTPVLLPIDELQASVISDLISAAESGNIVEHLKKYLNEDFLNSLVHALSESGLESLINSFFSPPTANPASDEPYAPADNDPDEREMASRMEKYIEQVNAMKPYPELTKENKSHKRICVMAEFKSLDDVEHAVCVAHPDGFTGESYLFKTDDDLFVLALSSGDMLIEDFRKSTSSLMNFYNGKETPEASLFSLLEHETALLKKNAVAALLGKI